MILLLVLVLLYLFALKGRTGNGKLSDLRGWYYAHRGLHSDNVPENSMDAFSRALDAGYGIELDIHLMKDGNLAVIHDSSLKRTAGADVMIEDLTTEDLEHYRLEGTQEKIPTLTQVLELFDGKAPLIVELKSACGNHAQLSQRACEVLREYRGVCCLESFDPRCISWLRRNQPQIIRGQLSENFLIDEKSNLPWIMKWIMSWNMANLVARPDFIAYRFDHRNHFSVKLCRKLWGIQGVCWTVRNLHDHKIAVQEGWIPIFEDYLPQ